MPKAEELFHGSYISGNGSDSDTVKKHTHTLANIMHRVSLVSSFSFAVLIALKVKTVGGMAVSLLHCLCFFTTTAPSIVLTLVNPSDDEPYKTITEFSQILYVATAVQKIAGAFPYQDEAATVILRCFDSLMGITAIIPIAMKLIAVQDRQTVMASIDGLIWCCNRILTPGLEVPEVRNFILAIKVALVIFFGIGQGCLTQADSAIEDA